MPESSARLLQTINQLTNTISDRLSRSQYTLPDGANYSVKSHLLALLRDDVVSETIRPAIRDLILCYAAVLSTFNSTSDHLLWIPNSLRAAASAGLEDLSAAYYDASGDGNELIKIAEEKRLLIEFMPVILPLLKDKIKESSIGSGDEITAASAGVPAAYAVVAAHQLRWIVSQVDYPNLGKLCSMVIPCALTALDHWSPQVKEQGMISFIHIARNVNAAEISWYEDVVLDACCQNVVASDDIWRSVVEMTVLLVTLTQRSNPRSPWYEKLLNEMLSHLERQPRDKERRVAWLELIEPFFNSMGLILLAHFRRIFPLFFKWMHSDDDETVILVLERIRTVLKLTWIRHSPYIERLVDELVTLYKESAMRIAREDIRLVCRHILILIKQSRGSQFEVVWEKKHREDPDLTDYHELLSQKANA